MSIQLALLKSGEQIIADVRQLVDDNDKVISLVFSNPYTVKFLTSELLFEGSLVRETGEVEHKVSFSPWIPLSEDKTIAVNPDWVVTVVKPNEWVKSSYEEKMNSSVDGVELNLNDMPKQIMVENFEVTTEDKNGN